MPIPAFDINRPAGLDAISQYIGQYATPEAAEADTFMDAPRGYDYLTDSYKRATGDAFADPFKDASDARTRALAEAAMSGASVATGGSRGPQILSLPQTPAPVATLQPGAVGAGAGAVAGAPPSNGTAPLLPPPTGNAVTRRDLAAEALTNMLQGAGRNYQLAGKNLTIPSANDPNYLQTITQRANLSGSSDLFQKIQQNNPSALVADPTDPRFTRDAKGNIVSSSNMHPIANDPIFMEATRRNPDQARSLYRAVSGRDYDTDYSAMSQQLVEQRAQRQKLIEGIKGLEADPVTGQLYKNIDVKDFDGSIKPQRVPLTPLEIAAIDKEGGSKRIFGVDLPNKGGLPQLPGMTDTERAEYVKRTQDLIKQKGLPVKDAAALVHRQMFAEQQSKISPPPAQPGKFSTAVRTVGDAAITGINKGVIDPLNMILGSNRYIGGEGIPAIPSTSEMEQQPQVNPIEALRQGLNYWQQKAAARYAMY